MAFPEEFLIDVVDKQTDDMFKRPENHNYLFEEWRAFVLPALWKISSTKAGGILLEKIRHEGKWIRILPMSTSNAMHRDDIYRPSATIEVGTETDVEFASGGGGSVQG